MKGATSRGIIGTAGERWVKRNVRCPSCHSKLILLPPGFPLVDVLCTSCLFRAQVKTNGCKPRDQIFGAGWEILDRSLKAGQLIPPLLVNYEWLDKGKKHHEVHFFPFLTRDNIQRHQRSRRDYKQFNWVGLNEAPKLVLYSRPK